MSAALRGPELLLPWESSSEEDRRFSRILGLFAGGFLVVALVMPLLPVPELPQEPPRAPQHLAQVILEPVALPEPPAPPPPKPQARPKPKAVEKPPRPVQPKPVEAPAPAPEPAPRTPEQARAEAAAAGVLAFQDDLQALRENVDVDTLAQAQLSRGAATAAATERAVITSEARASSGGIRSSELSRDTGGLALSGAETTRVQSSIGGTGTRAERTHSQSAELGGRSDESIRREMDRNKGAIFAIYNQALRRNPLLQGKLVFEMVIDGSGNIAEITLLDSELDDAELTRKILARIRMIRFPAEEVLATRVNYSFDFLPYKA
ncbi:MAG: AgmX/PglI C-terminal domain-containing protein [Halieaceae bacterium]|nr:AgmX/PglI C-terminal domain-containing protein [Halieaceae bacterium]MCP5203778.1 AgmX/PglI C-terminal domain-containing protein [Pseudomonadales bacterium]